MNTPNGTTLDQMMEFFQGQDRDWKNDYSMVRAAYQIAKRKRQNAISGSSSWVRWNRVESLAFSVMGLILDGRP